MDVEQKMGNPRARKNQFFALPHRWRGPPDLRQHASSFIVETIETLLQIFGEKHRDRRKIVFLGMESVILPDEQLLFMGHFS